MSKDPARPDDPVGGDKEYAELLRKLRKFFEWNHSPDPEDLAQETIRRGLQKIRAGAQITVDNPASYFSGIAKNILREQRKARRLERLEEPDATARSADSGFAGMNETEMSILLMEKLRSLPPDEQELLVEYNNGIRSPKGMTTEALRVRIHRILKKLKNEAGG